MKASNKPAQDGGRLPASLPPAATRSAAIPAAVGAGVRRPGPRSSLKVPHPPPPLVAHRSRHRSTLVVQRNGVQPGQVDPLGELQSPASKSLLYGMSTTRKETAKRLMLQDARLGLSRYRTVDAYNLAIGLNAIMDRAGDPSGIFLVREALRQANVVAMWPNYFRNADPGLAHDDDLKAWILTLKRHRYRIGLYDLGAPHRARHDYNAAEQRRRGRLGPDRFKKNFTDYQQWWASDVRALPEIGRTSVLEWFSADRTYANAQQDLTNLNPQVKSDLAKWVRTAFWRRTSKLGIDFTVARGHKIHFNTAADARWNPAQGGMPSMRRGDLAKINTLYGRMITTSEYRHVTKRIKSGAIAPGNVNFYDEF